MTSFELLKNHYAKRIKIKDNISSIVGVLECDEYLDKICFSTVYDYERVYDLLSSGIVSWNEMKDMIK